MEINQYCKKEIIFLSVSFNKLYKLNKNQKYIIKNITSEEDCLYNHEENMFTNSVDLFLIEGKKSKDILLTILPEHDMNNISIENLIKVSHKNGLSNKNYSLVEQSMTYITKLHYLFGKTNVNKEMIGLDMFYDNYISNFSKNTRKFNKFIMLLCYSYDLGQKNKNLKNIKKMFQKDVYHNSSVLVISKLIKKMGGVQKTSLQLIELLDYHFNVKVLSVVIKNKNFSLLHDKLSHRIPNNFIVNKKKENDIIEYINSNNFSHIIINKHHEVFPLLCKLNQKVQVICHNPKDIFNKMIIDHQDYIEKCYVLTNYHKNLLRYYNFNKEIEIYHNYVFKNTPMFNEKKQSFTNNICFVGRLAKEKNINLLINGFNYFNSIKPECKLYIIGNGLSFTSENPNIIFTGKLTFKEICQYFKKCDYTISSSFIEGKPFSVIEGMSYGLPCVHSNLVGINDVIVENQTGFLFDLFGYEKIKYNFDFDFFNDISKNDNKNIQNLSNALIKAYSISFEQYTKMSNNCIEFSKRYFSQSYALKNNIFNITKKERKEKSNKTKIFINFKPNPDVPYGGGNISVYYIVREFTNRFSDFEVVYELVDDIDIYLLIDVNKDRKFKKFAIEHVVEHRNKKNPNGKIFARINDCDITRIVTNKNSRELKIQIYQNNIDYYIYNSNFIKDYYLKKYAWLDFDEKEHCVIVNGCDQNLFKFTKKKIKSKIKIVTHHWSPNINKGYETYLKLWEYCKSTPELEFVFIGKHVPDMFKDVDIIGPYVKDELVTALNECHMYITDSKYDSCPNHVLEAISCGLPILYSNVEGGAKELSEMPMEKVGEIYNNFDELIEKIQLIKENYDTYLNNIQKYKNIFAVNKCTRSYYSYILKNSLTTIKKVDIKNKCVRIVNNIENNKIIINNNVISLPLGESIFLIDHNNDMSLHRNASIHYDSFPLKNKLNNNKINLLICSDNKYFCGVFALVQSIITNTTNLNELQFNFMLDVHNCDDFLKMLKILENKHDVELNKTIIYVDINIIDDKIKNSKCFNGGGHLLNIGNFSRLLIGEIFNYKKIMYLDADSIVQYDLYDRLNRMVVDKPMYAPKTNKHSTNKKKNFVIKQSSIIHCDYDFTNLIGTKINPNDYVFMGAPFVANCTLWKDVYKKIIKIIEVHNNNEKGIFKLFTMSLQNIVFYNKIGNLSEVFKCLQDLGSNRRHWDFNDLITHDILDWSGIFKPWFENGLHKELWEKYNVLKLEKKYEIKTKKKTTETKMITKKTKKTKKYEIVNDYIKGINIEECEDYLNNMTCGVNKNNNLNILYVCDIKYLILKMSRVRYWAIEYFGNMQSINLHLLGPGFKHFDTTKTLQENILNQGIHFDMVIWYKPMDEKYNFCYKTKLPFKTMLRYNEMWDFEFTSDEIEKTQTNIIICHHLNDYKKYSLHYKNDNTKTFYYNPHHADPNIFKPLNKKKIYDIMISGVCKQKHYPLKYRLLQLMKKRIDTDLKQYSVFIHRHPGYRHIDSFKSLNQKKYSELINKSKICLACTSKHNYRLGKYVEIPMCGSITAGDIPYEDKENFNDFVIEINMSDTDDEIIHKLKNALDNPYELERKRKKGIEWAKQYTTQKYVDKLVNIIKTTNSSSKIYIIADEIKQTHVEFKGEKWICDLLKEEFIQTFPKMTTTNAKEADIIWYLGPWNKRYIPSGFSVNDWFKFIKTKKVIMTQHHVDEEKLDQLTKQFAFMKEYGTKFHAICNKTKQKMKKYFKDTTIIDYKLWVNANNFYPLDKKYMFSIMDKYNINKTAKLIGSFQKDTEGKSNSPKLSKGPDLFVKIIEDMHKKDNNVEVVLAGLRRDYIIKQLESLGIKYYYFNMVSIKQLNELYNCLDLYVVSSRCEGGPRAIVECGLTKTPIISTKVGIAPELMHKESLFDSENWKSYNLANPNIEYLHDNVKYLTTYSHKKEFLNMLLE
tara:strand:+ start:2490 stop:8312 length:5823 start_codon:yes stop_codon:yes gene_type:complete